MITSFHLKAEELDEKFLKTGKALFKKKKISITIEEEMDETAYLLSTDANRKHLEESIKSKEKISFTLDELKKHSMDIKKGKSKVA
jgi:predicted transposase YbfD/YdcC